MPILRIASRDRHRYILAPSGEGHVVTWQVYPTGEKYLRNEYSIFRDGDSVSENILWELKTKRMVYTNNSENLAKMVSPNPLSKELQDKIIPLIEVMRKYDVLNEEEYSEIIRRLAS